jgi:hypothetical protein
MSISRRLFFGSVLGVGAASTVSVDAERQPEPIRDGDVLVIEHPGQLSEEGIRNLQLAIEHHFTGPQRINVVILEDGAKAKLLRPELARFEPVIQSTTHGPQLAYVKKGSGR